VPVPARPVPRARRRAGAPAGPGPANASGPGTGASARCRTPRRCRSPSCHRGSPLQPLRRCPAGRSVYAGKNAFIAKHKLVVFRLTQHWNRRKPTPAHRASQLQWAGRSTGVGRGCAALPGARAHAGNARQRVRSASPSGADPGDWQPDDAGAAYRALPGYTQIRRPSRCCPPWT
jgi:hypothetical protein